MNEAYSLEAQAQQLKQLVYLLNEDRQRLAAQLREVQDLDGLQDTLTAERVLASRLRRQVLTLRQQSWMQSPKILKPTTSSSPKIKRKLTCVSESTEASFNCGRSMAKVRMNPNKLFSVQPPRFVTSTQLSHPQDSLSLPHS